jgi:3-hydroxyisobutyrate dehydrogenase
MNWQTTNLDELLAGIWRALEEAALVLDHPFRSAGFATGLEMEFGARIVILRRVEAVRRTLICYSDVRASKVRHLRRNPEIQWLFHDPAARMQLRASGSALVHHNNEIARGAWKTLPAANRINYASVLAPGNRLGNADEAIPAEWRGHEPSQAELERAFENFAVITTSVDNFDWLLLGQDGNRRAGFSWAGDRFTGHWLVP